MDWKKLLSTIRVSELENCNPKQIKEANYTDPRSCFEKDCDQLIFSYPFRRLQDKTQVIPFPEYDFVHTRLTHSLEVSSVGRSFGKMVANLIFKEEGGYLLENGLGKSDIGALVAAACLAHDIGNPPFGHSGESSVSYFFTKTSQLKPDDFDLNPFSGNQSQLIASRFNFPNLNGNISETEFFSQKKCWNDLSNFEGNANGFRILTQNCDKGINPTIALLGTFTKYPRESFLINNPYEGMKSKPKSQSKYGFFQAEKNIFINMATHLGLIPINGIGEDDVAYHRHPLSFLMEASDDIAYGIIDFEDGCKLGLIDFDKEYKVINLKNKDDNKFESHILNASPKSILIEIAKFDSTFDEEKINNERDFKESISFLRSKTINVLIHECYIVFENNYEKIMTGGYDKALIEDINPSIYELLRKMKLLVRKYVYNYNIVLQSEASGFEVIYHLIESLAISSGICFSCGEKEDLKQSKLSSLLPPEYFTGESQSGEVSYHDKYLRMLKVLDYISGMTDNYAINLYRKIKGISLPNR